jgi:general stress protein YciG
MANQNNNNNEGQFRENDERTREAGRKGGENSHGGGRDSSNS